MLFLVEPEMQVANEKIEKFTNTESPEFFFRLMLKKKKSNKHFIMFR